MLMTTEPNLFVLRGSYDARNQTWGLMPARQVAQTFAYFSWS